MKCDRCDGTHCIEIANGHVRVKRCMTCFHLFIVCPKCSGFIGAKAPTYAELVCRNALCGYTTNLAPPKPVDTGLEDGA